MLQACEALAEAHAPASSTAISSRRTSSSRAAPTARRSVKVLDFGISKAAALERRAGQALTQTAARHGLAALHVARAAQVGARRRRAHRHLGARRHPVRAAHRRGRLPAPTRCPSSTCSILQAPPTPLAPSAARTRRRRSRRSCCAASRRIPARRYASVAELALALAEFAPGARAAVRRAHRHASPAPSAPARPASPRRLHALRSPAPPRGGSRPARARRPQRPARPASAARTAPRRRPRTRTPRATRCQQQYGAQPTPHHHPLRSRSTPRPSPPRRGWPRPRSS